MSAPNAPATPPTRTRGVVRRIAGALTICALVFLVLAWLTAFSFVTSLLVASGCCVVVVAASAGSDLIGMVLDAIAGAVLLVLGAIAAVFAALFSIFDF
jgi:hypothetical protein